MCSYLGLAISGFLGHWLADRHRPGFVVSRVVYILAPSIAPYFLTIVVNPTDQSARVS